MIIESNKSIHTTVNTSLNRIRIKTSHDKTLKQKQVWSLGDRQKHKGGRVFFRKLFSILNNISEPLFQKLGLHAVSGEM